MLTIERSLNIYAAGIPQIISLSQYDDDFRLVFTLYTSEGEFTIPSGTTAEVMGTKVDGNGYSATASISGSTVTVTGNKQMTACAGRNVYEIVLTNSGKRLATVNFILKVERAALDADTIQSETVLKELNAIIDSAATATEAAETATAAAESAAESARTLTIDPTLTQSGQAADAKVTGDKINDLKEDLNDLEVDYSDTSLWESGGITAAAGEDSANEKRIRTGYISRAINRVNLANGYKVAIYAYSSSDVYIGIYNGNGYQTSALYWYTSTVNLGEISSEYKLRLVGSKDPESSISPSDATDIFLEGYTDISLSQSGKAADAKAVRDAISAIEPGLSEDAKAALLNCFQHVAWADEHGQNYYNELYTALYGVIPKIRVFVGKGTSGTAIIDNANRALSEKIPLVNVAPITIEYPTNTDKLYSIKSCTSDTTVSSGNTSYCLIDQLGNRWSTPHDGWCYESEKFVVGTDNNENYIWVATTLPADMNGNIRLLFRGLADASSPVPSPIDKYIYINNVKYELVETDMSEFE